jgi:hypothetical protein
MSASPGPGSVVGSNTKPVISLSSVIADLHNGVTRYKKDPNYNPELGSIEEKYNLSATHVKELFKHSKLVGIRVKPLKEAAFTIVDDTGTSDFGVPSKAAVARLTSAEGTDTPEQVQDMEAPVEEIASEESTF